MRSFKMKNTAMLGYVQLPQMCASIGRWLDPDADTDTELVR